MNFKAIIGLGNPGHLYSNTRHNIGFIIIDKLAELHAVKWQNKNNLEFANIEINNQPVLLIKPLTYMNNSGEIVPFLSKKNIKPEDSLIIHDELEKQLGYIGIKLGGSAKGHNGLKSFITHWGDKFWRLKFGISRPINKEDVPNYVLAKFQENPEQINQLVKQAILEIEKSYTI